MKYQFLYTILVFLFLTACKNDYECTTYQIDGTGEVLPTKVELLKDAVKSDVDYYAKNVPYTLCLDENDQESFVYNDSSILAKVWDCAGVHGGGAYIGSCGDCIGGTTGKTCGGSVSNKDNNNISDCTGVIGGSAYIDECGNCVEGNTKRYPCISDVDGNYYPTVKIGTQIWMAENLKTTRYNNGVSINIVTQNSVWSSQDNIGSPAMCWQQNNISYKYIYGGLYNYHVIAETSRNVCPNGWRVPTYNDWVNLQNNIGINASGVLLKSNSGWSQGNGTDNYEFNALPGGSRIQTGVFRNDVNEGLWWSSSITSTTTARMFSLYSSNTSYFNYYDKGYGASIRCLKND